MADTQETSAKGGCLCGGVTYEIKGDLRGVVNCHCEKCRRTHGNVAAYTSIKRDQLEMTEERTLKWYRSVKDETPDVHRGFCTECGASLFWDPRGQDRIAVAAGSLDTPTHLDTIGHVWLSQAGDYYPLKDNLVKYEKGWGSTEVKR